MGSRPVERRGGPVGASGRSQRVAIAASGCVLLFGAIHVVWAFAYYWFPGFGRLTLGPTFASAFSRPVFMLYDLAVAALFVLAAALPLAPHRPWGARLPRAILRAGLWTAAVLLGVRGVGGLAQGALMLLGALPGAPTRWVVYDVWFLLCSVLLGAVAAQSRPRAIIAPER